MHTFAILKSLVSYPKVHYHTIALVDDADEEYLDLFADFVERYDNEEHLESLDTIKSWMEKLGEIYGAKEHFFRFEAYAGGDARALPPPTRFLETHNMLRLYCMRFDEQNVILFNGAEKTADKAQDCDHVRSHFLLANRLSKAIYQAFQDGDIWIEDGQLTVDDDFIITI